MSKHVFKGNVIHDGKMYEAGSLVPDNMLSKMQALHAVKVLEEAKPAQGHPAPQAPQTVKPAEKK